MPKLYKLRLPLAFGYFDILIFFDSSKISRIRFFRTCFVIWWAEDSVCRVQPSSLEPWICQLSPRRRTDCSVFMYFCTLHFHSAQRLSLYFCVPHFHSDHILSAALNIFLCISVCCVSTLCSVLRNFCILRFRLAHRAPDKENILLCISGIFIFCVFTRPTDYLCIAEPLPGLANQHSFSRFVYSYSNFGPRSISLVIKLCKCSISQRMWTDCSVWEQQVGEEVKRHSSMQVCCIFTRPIQYQLESNMAVVHFLQNCANVPFPRGCEQIVRFESSGSRRHGEEVKRHRSRTTIRIRSVAIRATSLTLHLVTYRNTYPCTVEKNPARGSRDTEAEQIKANAICLHSEILWIE